MKQAIIFPCFCNFQFW